MTEEALRNKYGLSAEQLRATRRQFREIRIRRVKAILHDIELGMTNSELMEKYQLSPEGLTKVRKESLESYGMEVEGDQSSYVPGDRDTMRVDLRKALRNLPSVVVSVCEAGKGGATYQLNDITEAGVGISGIAARIGEIKTIVVLGDEHGIVTPFEFQAECRWSGTQEPDGMPCAGFRITKISDKDYRTLREFIGQYTFAVVPG